MKSILRTLHHLFIPSARNSFRARVLHNDALTMYLFAAFLSTLLMRQVIPHSGSVLAVATDINVEKLLENTNIARQKNNLPPLIYNKQLSDAAYAKAQDMLRKDYWAHYSPDGKTPWDFILATKYQYQYAGENLAKNFLFSQNVVDAWMQSPTHRENMLRREFTEVGFAIVNGSLQGEPTTLVVQMFATPLIPSSNTKPQQFTSLPSVESTNPNEGSVQKSLITLPANSVNITYLFIGFLIVALLIDLFMSRRLNAMEGRGNNSAHIIFLLTILTGLAFFISKGIIL
jgi:uncharacterized protein YkwD